MRRVLSINGRFRATDGFSALELLMTVGIVGVLMGMAIMQIGQSLPAIKGDGAMRVVMAQMTTARELAITQRRIMRLAFVNGNTVQIAREEVPGPTTTILSAVPLESGATFTVISGIQDTPEAFGNASGVDFGSATQIRFGTDGTLMNQTGNALNGSVFVALSNQAPSLRAVTVLGATGRIRAYRWDGRQWKLV